MLSELPIRRDNTYISEPLIQRFRFNPQPPRGGGFVQSRRSLLIEITRFTELLNPHGELKQTLEGELKQEVRDRTIKSM